jgi:hypothetical protein
MDFIDRPLIHPVRTMVWRLLLEVFQASAFDLDAGRTAFGQSIARLQQASTAAVSTC